MYKLLSYHSINELCFGDSPERSKEIFGDCLFQKRSREGNLEIHFRDFIIHFKSENHHFNECTFHNGVELKIGNQTIDWSTKGLLSLCEADGSPMEYHGSIILFSYGISITGLEEDAESDRTITFFAKGEWDELKDEMKPFEFEKDQFPYHSN
jgi:hypothetical protein